MTSPNETQISTVMLQLSLEEIEQGFVNHHSLASALDEDMRRHIETLREAWLEASAVNAEVKAQKEENARLTISLHECQRECRDIQEMVKTTAEENEELERLIQQQQTATDLEINKLKKEMEEIIEKFRQIADLYDQEKTIRRTEEASEVLSDLLAEKERLEEGRDQLKNTLENMKSEIPENILEIMGKTELEKKLQDMQNYVLN